MKRWFLGGLLACMLLSSAVSALAQSVNIILDSDMAADADDTGDHAMLWALVKNGQANVLALVISSVNDYSAPTAWAIANYYGHPNVLIGAYHGNIPGDYHDSNSYYTQQVASQFGKPGDTRANYPDAVKVYRQALANAPNGSVYIICGGFYEPLKALLQSPADSISPLTGTQLVAQKVKALVPATGIYPNSGGSGEGNLGADPAGASYVAANWPTPVVWVDDSIGGSLLTGPAANANENTNPIKLAYDLQCGEGQWCPNALGGWTQAALLYAVSGLGNNFFFGGINGVNTVSSTTGANSFSTSTNKQQSYLEMSASPSQLNNIINPLVQAPPGTTTQQPPVANPQSLTSTGNAVPITLTATDPNGLSLTYSIVSTPTHGTLSGTPPNVTYTPSAFDGTDSFTFQANDGVFNSNVATVSIAVNYPPVAASQVLTNTGSSIPVTLSAADPDGDPLAYTVVTSPAHGTLSGTAPSLTYTPTAGFTGTDSFTFEAYDGALFSNIATVTITNDKPPVANSQSLSSTGNALSITLTATDPNGLSLTYSIVSKPTHGTLSGTAPNVTYTPAAFDGTDTFTFQANDGVLNSNLATVSIAVNDPPTANSQSVLNPGTASAITLAASDPDGDALTYSVVTAPAHGTLSGTAPALTYTPVSTYQGSDSFTFQASDGKLTSNVATVGITVDHPPVANAQSLSSTGNVLSIVLTATDPNGSTLTYSIVSKPTFGTLSGTAPNVQYTPPAAFRGTDTFAFAANDGIMNSNTATVSISVNYPPVATSQSVTTSTGNPVPITLTGSDPDHDSLTFAIVTGAAHGVLTGLPPNVTYTPSGGYSGSDSFTFQANDGLLNSNVATVTITISAIPPVNIILDSDIASDADDLGDHAMMWQMAKQGLINVVALTTSSINDYSAPTVWAVANWYGHPNVPIGAYQGNIPNAYHNSNSYYTQQITQQFGKPNDTRANYPDAVTVYRQALAKAANNSIVIISGGYYQPLVQLLQSPGDSISPLTGLQLVTQKVKLFVWCAGLFPNSGADAVGNLAADPDGANYVTNHWPTSVPIVWMDKQTANNSLTGPAANANEATNPIKLGYDLQCGNGQWCPNALPPWTQVGILYAVYGLQNNFFVAGSNGMVTVWNNSTSLPGWDQWNPTPNDQQSYLELNTDPQTITNIINPLIQAPPK